MFSKDDNALNITFYLEELDPVSLKLKDARKLIKVSKSKLGLLAKTNSVFWDFNIVNSRLLFTLNAAPKVNKDITLSIFQFGPNMDLEAERSLTLPFKQEEYFDHETSVDENGNIYLLASYYTKYIVVKTYSSVEGMLYKIDKEGKVSKKKLPLGEKFFVSAKLAPTENGVKCLGLYSVQGMGSIGTFFVEYDRDLNPLQKEIEQYPGKFLSEKDLKKIEKGKRPSERFVNKINDIYLIDNEIYIISEHNGREIDKLGNDGTEIVEHIRGMVYIFKFGKDGKRIWEQSLPKYFKSDDVLKIARYGSYNSYFRGNKLYIVYNYGIHKLSNNGPLLTRKIILSSQKGADDDKDKNGVYLSSFDGSSGERTEDLLFADRLL